MNLTEADRVAINRIIAEALGIRLFIRRHDHSTYPPTITKLPLDFCGDDAAARRAIRQLAKRGIETETHDCAKGVEMRFYGDLDSEDPCLSFTEWTECQSTLAAALADAMVEYRKVVGTETAVAEGVPPLSSTKGMAWRLKPALAAILKEVGE